MSAQFALPQPFLNTKEAARLTGLSIRTLEKHRMFGTGPKFSKVGGRVVYAASDLMEWRECGANTVRSKRDLPVADMAPSSDAPTSYDNDHLVTYLRLLDADAECADWKEVARIVLGLNPEQEPVRAHSIWRSHLERAKWMAEHGREQLVRRGQAH
jgi:hypothetical protein